MFDKNTLRIDHRDVFTCAIRRHCHDVLGLHENSAGNNSVADLDSCTLRLRPSAIRVIVRKRPIFPKEELKDYDVVSIIPGHPLPTKLALHNCLFQPDLKTPFINHLTFQFDHVFGQDAEDHHVYRLAAADLVRRCSAGGINTIFMFGQTGSGKTHTMVAIEDMAAQDLFQVAGEEKPCLTVQFMELKGNHCFDLLADNSQDRETELRLRECADGSFKAEGVTTLMTYSPDELRSALRLGHARRTTTATSANATSSRSHAICSIELRKTGGRLLLVDCAGTEWRKDSAHHSREQQQEGAEINASLHALKECVRHIKQAKGVPSHVYRGSALTKILAETFFRSEQASLAVICTVSPCATDTEHSVSTLRTGLALGGLGAEQQQKEVLLDLMRAQRGPRRLHPKQWTSEQVRTWLLELHEGSFREVSEALPADFTGQMLVRLSEARCIQLCNGNDGRGQDLFDLLHQEMASADVQRRSL